jgi:hypothetical protein
MRGDLMLGRPSLPWWTLPRPEELKRSALPRQYRLRLHDDDGRTPVRPRLRQPSPEDAISFGQRRPFDRALKNAELVSRREDLDLWRSTRPQSVADRRDQDA